MRYLKFLTVAVLSGLLLASCASVAHVEKDETVNFSKYRSYAWVESKDSKDDSKENVRVSDLAETRMREAVNTELAKVGWKESKSKPDVLISYDVLVENSVKDENSPIYSEPFTRWVYNPYSRRWVPIHYSSQFVGYDRSQRSVKEGTITINVIDAKTDKTVWQGWTTGEVNSKNLTSKEIQSAVKSIFRKFDVAKN